MTNVFKEKNVIIGGGIAGLYIGYQLKKRNEDFIILEKNQSPDRGRLYSVKAADIPGLEKWSNIDNFLLELGASVINDKQVNMMNLLKELKLDKDIIGYTEKSKSYFVDSKLKNKDARQKRNNLKQILYSNLSHLPSNYTYEDAAKALFNKEDFEFFKNGIMEWYELNLQNARIVKKAENETGTYYRFSKGIEEIVKVLTNLLNNYIYFGYQVKSITKDQSHNKTGTGTKSSPFEYSIEAISAPDKNVIIECEKVYLCTDYTCATKSIKYYNLPEVQKYLSLGFDRCCYRFYVLFRRPLNIEYDDVYGDFELKWSIKLNPKLWMITYVDGPLSCKLNTYSPKILIKKWIQSMNRLFNENITMDDVITYQGAFWKDAYTVLHKDFYKEMVPVPESDSTKKKYKYYGEIIREQIPSSFVCTVLPKDLGENTSWIEGNLINV